MKKQQGFGLPEVMISLLLSSFIMIALMNHYISTKQHYVYLQSAMDDAMELQWVVDFMRDSIRQAGFTPCLSINNLATYDHRDGHAHLSAIEVGEELHVNRMSTYFNEMLDGFSSSQLLLTSNTAIHKDRPILIADCYHAEVQRIVNVSNTTNGQIVTLASPLTFTYKHPVYVGEWMQERFFVRASRGLFYQRAQTDELTSLVKTITIKQQTNLVTINLGLGGDQWLALETRVRAA